jgi:hypothetical protein
MKKLMASKTCEGFHSIFLHIPSVIGSNIAIAPIFIHKGRKYGYCKTNYNDKLKFRRYNLFQYCSNI